MDAVRLNQEVLKLREMRLGPYHLATLTSRSNLRGPTTPLDVSPKRSR